MNDHVTNRFHQSPTDDAAVMTTLLTVLEREGQLTNADVQLGANALGIDPRSVRRKVRVALQDDARRVPTAWEPDEEFLEVLRAMGGNPRAAVEALKAVGKPLHVSLRTVQRALTRRYNQQTCHRALEPEQHSQEGDPQ